MSFASANLTAGQLNAIVKKLGGEEKAMSFLRGELVTVPVTNPFPLWKTISIGHGPKTPSGFYVAFHKKGMTVGRWTDTLVQTVFGVILGIWWHRGMVDLVKVSVEDLGFKQPTTRDEINAKAIELGLKLCPSIVGPELRRQYPDQPPGEVLLIGMRHISGVGESRYFNVKNDLAGLMLGSDPRDQEETILISQHFIFARPRKKA